MPLSINCDSHTLQYGVKLKKIWKTYNIFARKSNLKITHLSLPVEIGNIHYCFGLNIGLITCFGLGEIGSLFWCQFEDHTSLSKYNDKLTMYQHIYLVHCVLVFISIIFALKL